MEIITRGLVKAVAPASTSSAAVRKGGCFKAMLAGTTAVMAGCLGGTWLWPNVFQPSWLSILIWFTPCLICFVYHLHDRAPGEDGKQDTLKDSSALNILCIYLMGAYHLFPPYLLLRGGVYPWYPRRRQLLQLLYGDFLLIVDILFYCGSLFSDESTLTFSTNLTAFIGVGLGPYFLAGRSWASPSQGHQTITTAQELAARARFALLFLLRRWLNTLWAAREKKEMAQWLVLLVPGTLACGWYWVDLWLQQALGIATPTPSLAHRS